MYYTPWVSCHFCPLKNDFFLILKVSPSTVISQFPSDPGKTHVSGPVCRHSVGIVTCAFTTLRTSVGPSWYLNCPPTYTDLRSPVQTRSLCLNPDSRISIINFGTPTYSRTFLSSVFSGYRVGGLEVVNLPPLDSPLSFPLTLPCGSLYFSLVRTYRTCGSRST